MQIFDQKNFSIFQTKYTMKAKVPVCKLNDSFTPPSANQICRACKQLHIEL